MWFTCLVWSEKELISYITGTTNVAVSTTPPSDPLTHGAVNFTLWAGIGQHMLVLTPLTNSVMCSPNPGSIATATTGDVNCKLVKVYVFFFFFFFFFLSFFLSFFIAISGQKSELQKHQLLIKDWELKTESLFASVLPNVLMVLCQCQLLSETYN